MSSEREDTYEERVIRGEIGSRFKDALDYAIKNGAINLRRFERLEGRFGYSGGKPCDVERGPCSCGAWH